MTSDPSGQTRPSQTKGAVAAGAPEAFDFAALFHGAPAMIAVHEGADHRYVFSNPAHDRAVGDRALIGRPLREAMAELADQGVFERFDTVFHTGEPDEQPAFKAALNAPDGRQSERWYRQTLQPWRGSAGDILGVMSFAYDVTEEIAAKDIAQRRSEELEFALDAGGGVGAWDWNVAADTVDVDARFAALFGLPGGDAVKGLPLARFLDGIVEADRERVSDAVAAALESGEDYLQEYRVRTAEGDIRWVTARGRCFYGPDGAPQRFPGVVVDITEQVKARREMERTHALLRALLDNSASYVFAKDLEGRYIFANAFYLNAFGETEASLYGRTDRDRFGDGELYSINDRRVAETGEPMEFEEEAVASDGSTIHAISVKFPLRAADGSIFGAGSISTDISARKRAENALVQSEARRQRAMAAGRVGTFEYLAQEERAVWDPMTYDLFGLTSKEPITLKRVADIVHPDDRVEWAADVARALDAAGDGKHRAEFRITRPVDGEQRWIEATGRTSFDGDQPRVMLGTVRDITERKQYEGRLQLLNRELNHRVKNLFAVTQGMIRMSARQDPGAKPFADRLSARLEALAAAHLVGMNSDGVDPVALEDLLSAVLRPFLGELGEKIQLKGPAVSAPRRLVTPLGLTLHEMAMNAFKHGALARPEGALQIDWRVREEGSDASPGALEINWREECGEPVSPPENGAATGFGQRLIATSVLQMSAQYEASWRETGLDVALILPLEIKE
ncbi:MAG: PAS domain-containing protein [Oceanicaulis sp.]